MGETQTQAFPYPVPSDQPDVPSDIRDLAEAVDTKITAMDADTFTIRTVDLFESHDPGYPVNTTSTNTEVVFTRITVPSASYSRLLTITASLMLQYSQIESYDARLYVGAVRIDIDRHYDNPQNQFRSFKLAGQAILAPSTPGVVEIRHARAGGTGLVTPSVGAGSYFMQVTARRAA